MCRKCFYCLDCYEVDHPDNCTQTTACSDGKECYGLEKLGSNFKTAVQLGCIDRSLCDQLQSPSGHIFGRRDFTFSGGCCKGDKCNANPNSKTILTSTTTTTAQPHCSNHYHRCPSGFLQHGNNCYLFGNHRVTKNDADKFCRSHCAALFYIHSNSEFSAFAQYQHNGYIDVFTGLVRDHHHGWIWSHDGSPIQHSVVTGYSFFNQHVTGQTAKNCATANYQYINNNGHYSLRAVPCTDLHHPFCKLEMG
ncbi:lactose-binding lectin l-2-like [Mytilus californianus]|uniref:lactose-binding lectin l-2-like n=1 Tax=Mytilus californianus TaxID=6549 RepID=UPI002246E4A8|nr:lactose-binding lectin l-2-like [Mytilus californianus]